MIPDILKTPSAVKLSGCEVQDDDNPVLRKYQTVPEPMPNPMGATRDVIKVKGDDVIWVKYSF